MERNDKSVSISVENKLTRTWWYIEYRRVREKEVPRMSLSYRTRKTVVSFIEIGKPKRGPALGGGESTFLDMLNLKHFWGHEIGTVK